MVLSLSFQTSFYLIRVYELRVDLALSYTARTPEDQAVHMPSTDPAILAHISEHFPSPRLRHFLLIADDSGENKSSEKLSIYVAWEFVQVGLFVLAVLDILDFE